MSLTLFLSIRGKKEKKLQEVNDEKPYIKKPLNAYMLFMMDQRPSIPPEYWTQGSSAVNAHLGEKVSFLYFSQAI